jgi:hypothetical protein
MGEDERPTEQRNPPYVHLRRTEPKRRPLRLIAPLLLTFMVALILYDQVPWVRSTVERLLRPSEHQAREVCQRAALAAAAEPRFARVVSSGKVHRTSDAYYVERVVIGEMGKDAGETRFTYNCYVDPAGALIRGGRGAPPAAAPVPSRADPS